MRAALASTPEFVKRGPRAAAAWAVARRFYAQREFRPAWFAGGRPTRRVGEFVEALLGVAEHGLDPADYGAREINEASASVSGGWLARPVDAAVAARLDARLTYAFLRLATDLTRGRVAPGEISPEYLHRQSRDDVAARLREALDSHGVAQTLYEDPLPESYFRAFEQIENDPNHELIVAELNGEVVGTLHLTFLRSISYQGGLRAQVESVRVDRKYQNRGIGSKMMEWTIKRAKGRGAHLVQLTTHKSREDAHRFYERLGFKKSHLGMKLNLK